MTTLSSQFLGIWEKITESECAQIYPDTVQFQDGGLYFGHMDTPGAFTQWDVGTYKVVDSLRIRISTANDAILTYKYVIADDVLAFTDAGGCEFKYRKAT